MGGIVSDDEHNYVECDAIAKEPTKIQKGGKSKIVSYHFINYYLTTVRTLGNSTYFHSPLLGF